MAGGKQTPRQRMINILYLVLLGLIALNVPESLLDSFKKIGDSLSNSTKNVQAGITTNYTAFQKHLAEEPARAKPIFDKAQQATALSDKLYKDVQALKDELIKETGGIDPETQDYHGRDDMEAAERLMIKSNKGEELRKEISDTKEKLVNLLDVKDRVGINLSLDATAPPKVNGSPEKTWEEAYFGANIPVAAVMTSLTKIQSDAKNDEAQVTKKLMSKFDQAVVTLNTFEGVAVAPTSYIIAGQPYTAQVFLTAYDNQSNPDITINGSKIAVKQGKGTYTIGTSKEGIFTYSGEIAVKGPDGIKRYKLPTQTYQVSKPSAVVSPDKMNVLYIGLDNPLSVSAPGIPVEKLRVSISSGSITGSKGHYVANVSTSGTAKITISGETAPGKTAVLGSSEFRIKRVPPPKAQFGGKSGGSMSSANLRSQDKIFAKLADFEFDLQYKVRSFTLQIQKVHQDIVSIPSSTSGGELNAQQKAALQGITPGAHVYFDNIVAEGPGIKGLTLDPIAFSAN